MEENGRNKLQLVVLTPYETFFEGYVDSVILSSHDGEMGVMAGHLPLVVALAPGITTIYNHNEEKHFCCAEGYAEIGQHLALIVTNAAEWPEDLNVSKVIDAYNKRVEEMKEINYSLEMYSDRKEAYMRAKTRLKAITLYGTEEQKQKLNKLTENQA